jgi:hypothetical protein
LSEKLFQKRKHIFICPLGAQRFGPFGRELLVDRASCCISSDLVLHRMMAATLVGGFACSK